MNAARSVRVRTRKWPDLPHWEYDALRLGVDAHGYWIGVPHGTWIERPNAGFHATADHVVLIPHDDWWVACFYGHHDVAGQDRPVRTYVDVTTPATWSEDPASVTCVDLDLDVIQGLTGRVWVDDEDEFAEHQRTLGYPHDVIESAVASCHALTSAIEHRTPPFAGEYADWLARLRTLEG